MNSLLTYLKLMGLLLLSVVLLAVLGPLFFVYGVVRTANHAKYFDLVFTAISQLGNTISGPLFDDTLVKVKSYEFGDPDETISHVLGVNEASGNLTKLGQILAYILNWIDSGHTDHAATKNQDD